MRMMVVDRFTVKKEHLALLRNSLVDWRRPSDNDTGVGAPGIDSDYPYRGPDNLLSIAKILGYDLDKLKCPCCKRRWDQGKNSEIRQELLQIHRETEVVLDIILHTDKKVTPGTYKELPHADKDPTMSSTWVRI